MMHHVARTIIQISEEIKEMQVTEAMEERELKLRMFEGMISELILHCDRTALIRDCIWNFGENNQFD